MDLSTSINNGNCCCGCCAIVCLGSQAVDFATEPLGDLGPSLPTGQPWRDIQGFVSFDPVQGQNVFGSVDDTFRAAGTMVCCDAGSPGMTGTFYGDAGMLLGTLPAVGATTWGVAVEWDTTVDVATFHGVDLGVIGTVPFPLTPAPALHEGLVVWDEDNLLAYFYVDGVLVDAISMPPFPDGNPLFTGIMVADDTNHGGIMGPGGWLDYQTGCVEPPPI